MEYFTAVATCPCCKEEILFQVKKGKRPGDNVEIAAYNPNPRQLPISVNSISFRAVTSYPPPSKVI